MSKLPKIAGVLALVLMPCFARAVDFSGGVMTAVPVKDGRAPKIDADLSDWDLTAQEPVFISEQSAPKQHAEWAFMSDDEALYVSAVVSMPGRPYTNPSNPQDAFWRGDILQMRLSADPSLSHPLDAGRDAKNDRVAHISFWKNSESGENFLHVSKGTKLDLGETVNPEGARCAIRLTEEGYVMEARLPWSALGVPGGKNPFEPGDRTAMIVETLWIGGDTSRVAACFHRNPGTFAFLNPSTWGQLEFSPASLGERRRPTMEQVLERVRPGKRAAGSKDGVTIRVDVPEDGLKLSLNVLGPKGEIVRDLVGAEPVEKGSFEVKWDGRDAWGHPMEPGTYRWGAYLHGGLKAEFAGSVGSSGIPFYPTADDKGGWGGDHSNPVGCVADESGTYFLWPSAEAGRAIVKLGRDDRVLWRKNPFVGGGFGPFYAMASDGRHLYLARGTDEVFLSRIDAKTGALQTWSDKGPAEISLGKVPSVRVAWMSTPVEAHEEDLKPGEDVKLPDTMGMAVRSGKIYVSSYARNRILVRDASSAEPLGELECPSPKGLALDGEGNLYAVSHPKAGRPSVVRFAGASGAAQTVVSEGLEAPFGVAAGADGRLFVSDLGGSQQVKIFDASGTLQKSLGEKGGRSWQGKYDPDAFLRPAGLAVDGQGRVLLAESSPPKVISRISPDDGRVLRRWFGPGVYWNSTWPMPDDPEHVFYLLNEAVGRGRIAGPDRPGDPDAYWDPARAGYPFIGNIEKYIPQPETVRAANNRLYFVQDVTPHSILLLGEDGAMRPVAQWRTKGGLVAWVDQNGDGQVQPGEETQIKTMPDGSPLPPIAELTSSLHMEPDGDLYFATQANRILKVPTAGFQPDGTIRWDLKKMSWAVPEVLPGLKSLPTGWREGILGTRVDRMGNVYTLFNAGLQGKEREFDFATPGLAKQLMNGMGHTSRFNVVKFAKYDPEGRLLWMAGRKAVAGAQPGEMYHFWNMAGLLNDRYVAGGSEWGQIYIFTHDGFFVDALMNNPGDVGEPGPYTFGGETSGGRVQYFPKTGEAWAYSSGMAYRIRGFEKGGVAGERRLAGEVRLDKVYESSSGPGEKAAEPIRIVRLGGNPLRDEALWKDVPASRLDRQGGELAEAQFGYDDQFFYGRIRVVDASPLENSADNGALAFKGGDTAGIVLGQVRDGEAPGPGDLRLMAAKIGGRPRLLAMKAVTGGEKQPFEYYTPAAGRVAFEFVGEVPNAEIKMMPAPGGYVAMWAVPRSFLEFDLSEASKLRGDVEIRLSGPGQRGPQATSRNYLFTPARSETTMTDDIPTESRMFPQYWGPVEIR